MGSTNHLNKYTCVGTGLSHKCFVWKNRNKPFTAGKKRCCNNTKRCCGEEGGKSVPVPCSIKSICAVVVHWVRWESLEQKWQIPSIRIHDRHFPHLVEVVQSFQNEIIVTGYLPNCSFLSKLKVDEPCCSAMHAKLICTVALI